MPFKERDQVFNESRELGTITWIRCRRVPSWDGGPGITVERTAIKVIGRVVAYYDPALCIFCADVWVEGESYTGIRAIDELEPLLIDETMRRCLITTRAQSTATREAIAYADWWYGTVGDAIGAYNARNDMPDEDLIARAVKQGTVYTPDL